MKRYCVHVAQYASGCRSPRVYVTDPLSVCPSMIGERQDARAGVMLCSNKIDGVRRSRYGC